MEEVQRAAELRVAEAETRAAAAPEAAAQRATQAAQLAPTAPVGEGTQPHTQREVHPQVQAGLPQFMQQQRAE
eukprot:235929-Pleurochrysis_carterae.AAC.1